MFFLGIPEPRIVWLKDYVPLDVYNNQRLRLIEKGKAKGKPISPRGPTNQQFQFSTVEFGCDQVFFSSRMVATL